jgi:hypothetical protein
MATPSFKAAGMDLLQDGIPEAVDLQADTWQDLQTRFRNWLSPASSKVRSFRLGFVFR